jgi:DNA mismatch endonuclease, patch repair protein
MGRIRSTGTAPELEVRRSLTRAGIRYRLHDSRLPGRPDLAIHRAKIAIFVDGCFWHGCPVHYNRPHVRQSYWDTKVKSNRARRARVLESLSAMGWRSYELWECEVRTHVDFLLLPIIRVVRSFGPSGSKRIK